MHRLSPWRVLCAGALETSSGGCFQFGGHSYGARVAYEIARQLTDQGREVHLLGIFDSWPKTPARASVLEGVQAFPAFVVNLPPLDSRRSTDPQSCVSRAACWAEGAFPEQACSDAALAQAPAGSGIGRLLRLAGTV